MPRGHDHGLKVSNATLGLWKNECWPNTYLSSFAAIGAKNYSYTLNDNQSHEPVASITKVRGIAVCQKDQLRTTLNIDLMQKFIKALQQDTYLAEQIPQGVIRIGQKQKVLQPKEIRKCYANTIGDAKRFFKPQIHPSKLWSYGTCTFG